MCADNSAIRACRKIILSIFIINSCVLLYFKTTIGITNFNYSHNLNEISSVFSDELLFLIFQFPLMILNLTQVL